jgi:hypothetical protein
MGISGGISLPVCRVMCVVRTAFPGVDAPSTGREARQATPATETSKHPPQRRNPHMGHAYLEARLYTYTQARSQSRPREGLAQCDLPPLPLTQEWDLYDGRLKVHNPSARADHAGRRRMSAGSRLRPVAQRPPLRKAQALVSACRECADLPRVALSKGGYNGTGGRVSATRGQLLRQGRSANPYYYSPNMQNQPCSSQTD